MTRLQGFVVFKDSRRALSLLIVGCAVAMAVAFSGCESTKDKKKDKDKKPGSASGYVNSKSFEGWTVMEGHPWDQMEERRKEQARLKKKESRGSGWDVLKPWKWFDGE